MIAFERAGVRLGSRTIWRGIDLEFRAGECVAILGPNGAGKSTLLKTLLGLLPLSEGSVRVLGTPVRRGNPAIGYLPQAREAASDSPVRGRDIVWLGLDGTRWGVPVPLRWGKRARRHREEQRRVQDVIEQVGAGAYADRPLMELSGGERQRLLIAQALVTRPRILLLDEPLEGLDLRTQQAVSALVGQLGRRDAITTLVVLHDVNPLLPYVDRVVYLARGQALIGPPDTVITAPTLSQVYGSPVDVLRGADGRVVVVGLPEEVSYHAH